MRLPVTFLSVALLAGAATWLYATRLDETPVYLMHDEAQGALQAHSIATTGRDLTGRLLPVYFTEPEFPPGRDPLLIYVTALLLKFAPFSQASVRAAAALIATLNVVLMFLVARRLFQSTAMGLVAAALLLLTPIHFIRGRLLLSPLFTIPFILLWVWTLWRFTVQPTTARLAASAAVLGVGMYSYLAAVAMMPLYLLITLAIGYRRLGLRAVITSGAVFLATLLPMAAWYVTHPERNAEIVSAYQLETSTSSAVARWVRLYWGFFDPSFLFISGDASAINSTREAGFFPMAFAVLIPIGVYALIRSRQPLEIAIALGFLTAPLVSMISGAIEMNRVMFAIPFGVLAASYGAHTLLGKRVLIARAAALALLASVAWQFAGFYSGYMGSYRMTSAEWFAGSAREGVRAAMNRAAGTTAPIYVSPDIEWVHRTWRFYALADGKSDMIGRVVYAKDPPADAAPGSVFLVASTSDREDAARRAGWRQVETATSIDGSRSFSILLRAEAAGAAR